MGGGGGPDRRFGKRRWRRPERMMLDGPPVARRKDLGVQEPLPLEPELARRASRRHLEVLLVSFGVLCAAEGALIGLIVGRPIIGTLAVLVVGALYFFVAREFGDGWIVKALGAEPVDGTRTLRLASSEAKSAGIPAPGVLVAPGDVPNALSFALRRRWVVTTHACETLDELELEGMLAHEVVHLRDGEATVVSLFVALAGGADLLFRGAGAFAALSLPLWPVALVLRLLGKRVRPADVEHRADIAAALLTRYPPGIETALRTSGGPSGGVKLLDPFWFVARDGTRGTDAERRAELVSEM
jgi:Zn-dependent protease with chaperone function